MTTSQEYSDYLHASDGTRLFYRQWHHPQARGAIVLVHGLGEHSGRYQALTEIFLQRGLSVRIYDQRGHGRSDGARGSLQHSDDYLSDLKLVFDDFAGTTSMRALVVRSQHGRTCGGAVCHRRFVGGARTDIVFTCNGNCHDNAPENTAGRQYAHCSCLRGAEQFAGAAAITRRHAGASLQ